jgi:hypothetical protein
MKNQFLKQVIESNTYTRAYLGIHFEGNQLVGSLNIDINDRFFLLCNEYAKDDFPYAYLDNKPTEIMIASDKFFIQVEDYKKNKLIEYKKTSLGYESFENIEGKLKTSNEKISTVFSILKNDETAAFFDFDLTLEMNAKQVTLTTFLNQVYVKPIFGSSTYWMDLTIAIYEFIGLIASSQSNYLGSNTTIDIVISEHFQNSPDTKIAKIIESEIRKIHKMTPDVATNRPAAKSVVCEI